MNSPSQRHSDPQPRPSTQQAAQHSQEAANQNVLQVPDRLAPAFARLLQLVAQLDGAHRPLYLGGGAMDPDAVQVGLSAIPELLRKRIADAVASIPENLHELDSKPLIDPTWDVELPGLAQRIAPAVRHASVELLPPCALLQGGPVRDGPS